VPRTLARRSRLLSRPPGTIGELRAASGVRPQVGGLRYWWGVLGLNQRPLACRLSDAKRSADLHRRVVVDIPRMVVE
jgi:hypothetical protein